MNEFDSTLTKSLEDFMESYKMIDVEQIYSNGTEFVPIFRVKQWLEYNNINNLQFKIDKINQYLEEHFIFDDENGEYYQTHTFDKDNAKELHDILKEE